ncbi:MAG: hypothetical protein ACI9T7_000517 [Oleiphilaceae bacterium]|jgi:hypothetical protein
MYEDEIPEYLEKLKQEHEEKIFFVQHNLGAEVHWFFHQALAALKAELYLPACASFLIGIEASLRITQAQIDDPAVVEELDPMKTLSNRLIKAARDNGLPVHLLAFPDEHDFDEKLATTRRNLRNIEIVRVRHDLCHGNILEHRNPDLGDDLTFFTPECVRDLAEELYTVSKVWVVALGEFRTQRFDV